MPLGGKLKMKGLPVKGEKKRKRKLEETHEAQKMPEYEVTLPQVDSENTLTEAQRRHREKMREREKQNIKKMLAKTHRERVDDFNEYLSKLTEHNDIPRVSAAGNG